MSEAAPVVTVDEVTIHTVGPDGGVGGDGAVLLDVREQDEWDAGHAPGALHVPLGDLPARLAELPGDAELQVVCRAGGRAARAASWLVANGYDAVVVDGGMGAWLDAGRPLVAEGGQEPRVL